MNHYQQGFLAGLTNEAADTNPLLTMHIEFLAGEQAKQQSKNFNEESWPDLSLTFREGFKSLEFGHLASKGAILKTGFKEWELGHLSGFNKYNNVLASDVLSVSFAVSIAVTAFHKEEHESFIQHYTFLDHRNDVYRIEARHRLGLNSVYPREHIINKCPCLPGSFSIADIENESGKEIMIGTHDILQSASAGYQPITLRGINFLSKSFQSYTKLLLDVPQWNIEANNSVDWELKMPIFS
ncbi:MAG: hypothetical protein ACJAS1_005843 [Oleiphilaceae bacterium]|jgi:hypothetical protein